MPSVRQLFSAVILVAALALAWQAISARLSGSSVALPDQAEHVFDSDNTPQDDRHSEPTESTQHHADSSSAPKRVLHERAPPVPHSRTIVAIGDLHGDGPSAMAALLIGGVVDREGKWSGKVDYLVQTGDIIDRGRDTQGIYKFMDRLREEAQKAGGNVVSLLGNHEYLNVIPFWPRDYVSEAEIATFGNRYTRWLTLSAGYIGESWRNNYRIASRLPLHPAAGGLDMDYNGDESSLLSHAAIAFVHGGLAPDLPELTPFPSHINKLGHSALRKLQLGRNPNLQILLDEGKKSLERLTKEENSVIGDQGPLWFRGWANHPDEALVCEAVEDVLKKTGTRRMVMGHSRQSQGILSRCDGKIIVIDTGISSFYEGHGRVISALRIQYTLTPRPESVGQAGPPVWDEKEVVTALYPGGEHEIGTYYRKVIGYF